MTGPRAPERPAAVVAEELRALYDSIWEGARAACARNRVVVEDLPEIGGPRWGVSAVFRIISLGDRWDVVRGQLVRIMGPKHNVYDRATQHLTFQVLEPYRPDVHAADSRVALYVRAYTRVFRGVAAIRLRCAGITASRSSVLAQCWPEDDSVARIRVAGLDAIDAEAQRTGQPLTKSEVSRSLHITLATMTGPLAHPTEFVNFVEANRTTYFARLIFDTLELVRYDRSHSGLRVTTLGSVPFANGDSHGQTAPRA